MKHETLKKGIEILAKIKEAKEVLGELNKADDLAFRLPDEYEHRGVPAFMEGDIKAAIIDKTANIIAELEAELEKL